MDAASDKRLRARRRIRSIEVGFRVIRAMLSAQRPTPLRDIAAAAGMPPSKAHLYLASFSADPARRVKKPSRRT